MIKVTRQNLDDLLQKSSFQLDGDSYEQSYGHLVVQRFPNCELFWKLFVVPLTERISDYPNALTRNIRPRNGVDQRLEDLANTNYTTFLNLVYAHIHLQNDTISSLENFYTHLGSTCDLVETFLERFFFILMECRGDKCEILQEMKRDDFIQLTGEWYDSNYSNLYEHYFSKGKSIPINIPSRRNVIKELFITYLNNDKLRKQYATFSQSIRQFRNVIVHDVQVGRLQDKNGNTFIPKPKLISKYKTWRQVFSVAGDIETINRDFRLKKEQMDSDIAELETIFNEIWKLIIQEFTSEFYSEERKQLRDMYSITI